MEFHELKIVESDVPCNCPWMECPEHPDALCKHNSSKLEKCPNPECQDEHFLGDITLGGDFHICKPCIDHLLNIVWEELPELMNAFHPYVPAWMTPLETFIRETWKSKFSSSWVLPQEDCVAILGFAFCVCQNEQACKASKRSRKAKMANDIPLELVDRLAKMKRKITGIVDAYAATEVRVSHE